jgi:hypothetical protein
MPAHHMGLVATPASFCASSSKWHTCRQILAQPWPPKLDHPQQRRCDPPTHQLDIYISLLLRYTGTLIAAQGQVHVRRIPQKVLLVGNNKTANKAVKKGSTIFFNSRIAQAITKIFCWLECQSKIPVNSTYISTHGNKSSNYNFYREFWEDHSYIMAPLTKLAKWT